MMAVVKQKTLRLDQCKPLTQTQTAIALDCSEFFGMSTLHDASISMEIFAISKNSKRFSETT
jgi:hypothetical protein